MQIVGTVMEVAIDTQCPKNGGGSYPGTRITYRDADGSLKDQLLHANATKYDAPLREAIASLKPGDKFTMIKEKEGAHWNVKSIVNGVVPQATQPAASGGSTANTTTSSGAGNSSPKSTYQTAEERAQVQVYIVRQSTITQAINYFKDFDERATIEDVIELAKRFEAHVFGNEYDDGSIEHIKSDIL